jgi:cell division septation protein DedD
MTGSQEGKSLQLDHRHLAFFFLAAVGVCAVFFALGYTVGRAHSQTPTAKEPWTEKTPGEPQAAVDSLHPNESPLSSNPQTGETEPETATKNTGPEVGSPPGGEPSPDLDFYKAVKDPKVEGNFHPDSKPEKKAIKPSKSSPSRNEVAQGSTAQPVKHSAEPVISLQVAALKSTAEAEKLSKTLRSKGYRVFMIHPDKDQSDHLIRVQVGPYKSESESNRIKKKLESEGYKTIIKRQ